MTANYYVDINQDDTTDSGFGAFGINIGYDPETYQRTDLDTTYRYDTETTRALSALSDQAQAMREQGATKEELQPLFDQMGSLDAQRKAEEKAIWKANAGNSWISAAPYAMLALSGAPLALGQALGGGAALGSTVLNTGITAAQGKDVSDILKAAALSYAGGTLGDRIATGVEYGVNPFGEQAGMLAAQTGDMGVYGFLPTAAGGTAERLVRGENLEDAIIGGLAQGVREGDFDTGLGMDIDLQTPEFLREFDKEVIRPVGEALSEFDKDVLQPVTQPVYGAIKDAGRTIDDVIIDPVDQAIRDIDLPDVSLPEVDMPSLDLPSVDIPSLNLSGLFDGLVAPEFLSTLGGAGQTTGRRNEDWDLFTNPYKRINPRIIVNY